MRALALAVVVAAVAASAAASAPASTGRNGLLVFSKKVRGNVDLYTATAAGKHLRRVTKAPGQDLYGAWSPDGTRIAYTYYYHQHYSVWMTSPSGGRPRRVSPARVGVFDPSWSPDGTKLAVGVETLDGEDDVAVLDIATGQLTNITNSPGDDLDPAWSPDGAKIVFATNRDDPTNQTYDLYTATPDGATQTRLTATSESDDAVPVWSPDGTRIAFVSAVGSQPFRIVVMNADGTGGAAVVSGGEPAWSPDGTQIAFSRSNAIWIANADGTGAHRIVKTGVFQGAPDWQSLQ
jgi:TolB protein